MTKHCLCINGPLKGEAVAVSDKLEFFRIPLPLKLELAPFRFEPKNGPLSVEYRVAQWVGEQGHRVWLAYTGNRPTNNEVASVLRGVK